MQHYGAPTRLLDFTYSVYVAAYFALERATSESGPTGCEVWAINTLWARKSVAAMFTKDSDEWKYITATPQSEDDQEKGLSKFIMTSNPKRLVLIINPFRRNERLLIQRGVFAIPGDIEMSFEENLSTFNPTSSEHVARIKIPANLRNEGIELLYNMGISRASLFPGLDGFSQSLRYTMPLVLQKIIDQEKALWRNG